MSSSLNFVMQNTVRFKQGKRDQGNKLIVEFLSLLKGEVDGFGGYMVMNSTANQQGSIVLTFWETKQSMDTFYRHKNAILSDFNERFMPLVEKIDAVQSYRTEIADVIPMKTPVML